MSTANPFQTYECQTFQELDNIRSRFNSNLNTDIEINTSKVFKTIKIPKKSTDPEISVIDMHNLLCEKICSKIYIPKSDSALTNLAAQIIEEVVKQHIEKYKASKKTYYQFTQTMDYKFVKFSVCVIIRQLTNTPKHDFMYRRKRLSTNPEDSEQTIFPIEEDLIEEILLKVHLPIRSDEPVMLLVNNSIRDRVQQHITEYIKEYMASEQNYYQFALNKCFSDRMVGLIRMMVNDYYSSEMDNLHTNTK